MLLAVYSSSPSPSLPARLRASRFALYATHIGSYSRLYGSLAGLVVFLVRVWFTNLALLAGAQFNVELLRVTSGRS